MLVVIAAWQLPYDQFIERNKNAFELNETKLVIVSDKENSIALPWVKILKYPHELKEFSLPKLVNYGIRQSLDDDIIIKSDVDIVFGSYVFDCIGKLVTDKIGFAGRCCYTTPEYGFDLVWDEKKVQDALGGCVAFTSSAWDRLCGFNENMAGWGYEDFDLIARAREKIEIIDTYYFHLWHINHPLRKSFTEHNNNDANREIAKQGWNDRNWGI